MSCSASDTTSGDWERALGRLGV